MSEHEIKISLAYTLCTIVLCAATGTWLAVTCQLYFQNDAAWRGVTLGGTSLLMLARVRDKFFS